MHITMPRFLLDASILVIRDVSEVYWKNLKWYTDIVWKSEFIIKPCKKGYKDEISKNIFKYFEVKVSEISQKSENLHPWVITWKWYNSIDIVARFEPTESYLVNKKHNNHYSLFVVNFECVGTPGEQRYHLCELGVEHTRSRHCRRLLDFFRRFAFLLSSFTTWCC